MGIHASWIFGESLNDFIFWKLTYKFMSPCIITTEEFLKLSIGTG